MKVVKAKYYEASNEIIPLNPQPIRINGAWVYERAGMDAKGEYVVIDFISEDSVYFDYDANGTTETKELQVTTEEEWHKPAILDTENMDLLLSESAHTVDANILEKSVITNIEQNQVTSQMGIVKLIQIIKQRCLSVLGAITSIFRK